MVKYRIREEVHELEGLPGMIGRLGHGKWNQAWRPRRAERGFALVAALLAIWILTAVGILVFSVSTQDLRISSRLLGEKKAFSAAETGLHWLTQNFDCANPTASERALQRVDPVDNTPADPQDQYSVRPGPTGWYPTSGPATIWYPGFENEWGRTRYESLVTGTNLRYHSSVEIHAGIGYGPIKIGPGKQ